MTTEEFNIKYKDHLEQGFYGLAIQDTKVIEYLDKEFESIIRMNNNFTYSQIKMKWNNVCFYSNLDSSINRRIERHCKALLEPNKISSILYLLEEEWNFELFHDEKTFRPLLKIDTYVLDKEDEISVFGNELSMIYLQSEISAVEASQIIINLEKYKK